MRKWYFYFSRPDTSPLKQNTLYGILLYIFPEGKTKLQALSHHPHLNYSLNLDPDPPAQAFRSICFANSAPDQPAHTLPPSTSSNQSPCLLSTWKLSITIWKCMQMVVRRIAGKYDSAHCWKGLMRKNAVGVALKQLSNYSIFFFLVAAN